MATVPVSKPMLPARICRIKSGSRIVPILIALDPCRLAVKTGYARCRVGIRILGGAIQADVLGLTSWCAADTISAHRTRGSLPQILPPRGKRFCALQLRNENANPRISRTIGIAKVIREPFSRFARGP